jgi:pimeloyl-ACP methyl ester carboxylesterase
VINEHQVRAGGFRTRYLSAGPEHGAPTVLLIHDGAFGADARVSWLAVIERLADRYRVLAPDLLGYGGTDKAIFFDRSPYEFRIEHLAAFCAELGVDQVHAVGASFGGSVVLRALAGARPRLPLLSAVSIAGTGGPGRRPDRHAALAEYDGSEADMRRIVRLMVDDYPGMAEQVLARHRNTMLPGHVEACMAPRLSSPTASPRPPDDWPAELAGNSIPVLLVAGSRDDLLEPGWLELFGNVPHVSVRRMNCRHAPNLDRPQELVDLLTDFISTHS